MDRKGIIAVAICILVLVLWEVEYGSKIKPPSPASAGASPSPAASVSGTAGPATAITSVPSSAPTATPGPAATPEPSVPEQITSASGPKGGAIYQFTNRGGGIASAALTSYPAESGSDVTLNITGALPIGAISDQPEQGADLPYTVTVQGNNVLCVRDQPGGLTITKKFTLPNSLAEAHGYKVGLSVSFTNHTANAIPSGGYYLYIGSAAPIHQNDLSYYTGFDWENDGRRSEHTDVNWFAARSIPLVGIQTREARPIYTADADKVTWAGVSGQYFTTIVTPLDGAAGRGVWARRYSNKPDADMNPALLQPKYDLVRPNNFALEGLLKMPAFTVNPGQTVTQNFDIYAGPKIYGVLKGLGAGQEKIITYYFSYLGISIGSVAVALLNSMNLLHSWVGSYAIAIIIMTLAIRGILWPIQNRATASMRQMQELQPRMTELKEKYKDDPARMNQEVMKLYKEYKVNPLAGCLPMLIQIPIFFGFYRVLATAVELRNSRFLWVRDLSQPDTVFHVSGFPVNILPICMAVSMIFQMRMTPRTGDKNQQQMMLFMPLIFVVFCYNFASGLALYYTISNLASIVQLYVTRARTAPAPLKATAKKRFKR